jgi:prepilin-type N-terminal cleavage/methylation domain-containing protein
VGVHNLTKKAGFTLIELLIAIALMALIVGALDQVAGRVLSTYSAVQASQDLIPQARYALERMVTFVQESDQIQTPPTTDPTEVLAVSERLSDQYTNATRIYTAGGDGLLDADTDADGLVDEAGGDPAEFITFDLDKTDTANWKLMEKMPNYGTISTSDFNAKVVICERVTAFTCTRLSAGIVAITLTLQQGSKAVTLRTTAKARWVD